MDEVSKTKSEHYVLIDSNINSHFFAFSFDTRGAKEKASQKENAVFSGALPLLTPPPFEKGGRKLSLIALREMYKVPDSRGVGEGKFFQKVYCPHVFI